MISNSFVFFMARLFVLLLALCALTGGYAQTGDMVVMKGEVGKQHYFSRQVPAGNYSGLTWMGGDQYLMVSDKGAEDGIFFLSVQLDSLKGKLLEVRVDSFVTVGTAKGDVEGIAYLPETNTVLLSREADQRVVEYRLDGKPTGRELAVSAWQKKFRRNYGFEALTYQQATRLIWTATESTLPADGDAATAANGVRNRIRLQSFGEDFLPRNSYAYEMDAPSVSQSARIYVMGVSELVALPDGSLLVLEREVFIPKKKLGAFCQCKLYQVFPAQGEAITNDSPLTAQSPFLSKSLVCQWKTRLNLLHQDFANYEGACLGSVLSDGSLLLLLCADSQNQESGILRDWFLPVRLSRR